MGLAVLLPLGAVAVASFSRVGAIVRVARSVRTSAQDIKPAVLGLVSSGLLLAWGVIEGADWGFLVAAGGAAVLALLEASVAFTLWKDVSAAPVGRKAPKGAGP